VLLRIGLAGNEVASLTNPPPFFCLVSRLSYVPCLFNDLLEHFGACLPPRWGKSYEIWLDYEGTALKWQYPLGVLCDTLVGQEVPSPLHLTVHFQGQEGLRPFTGMGDLQGVVMSAVSQATYTMHNSQTPYGKLGIKDHNQLWEAICKCNLDSYWAVQKSLLCQTLAKCKSLPVRIHLCGPLHEIVLHPAPPLDSQGAACTVGGFLQDCLGGPPLFTAHGALCPEVQVLTLGVSVPLDTPLFWLALHAAYLDEFVHLVLRVPNHFLVSEDGEES